MLYLKVFEEFETEDFELEFVPIWKFNQSYKNTKRFGFSNKIYQDFALNANLNGMRTDKVGDENPTQMILEWNKPVYTAEKHYKKHYLFHGVFLIRKYEGDTPYVLCLVDYNSVGDTNLKSLYIRMELEDLMGIIKNFEKFSNQIIEKIESL